MEENFEYSLKSLKEKFKYDDTACDSVDVEKSLREFKTELYIKRGQVKQLRSDLEIATTEVNELKKALDAATASLDEKSFNLNVLSKKFRATEDELMEKIDALNTVQVQHKLTAAEIEKVKESLQKSETEKLELSRKLEVFETKHRQSFIYHNQILKRETNLKSTIDEVQEMIKKVMAEQAEVTELSRKTKIVEESSEKYHQLSRNYEKLKKEKETFEEQYIKMNAKYEMLEELLNLREDIKEPGLANKVIFNQWKSNRQHYQLHLEENNEILGKVTELYNEEKSLNSQLIESNEELTNENTALKTKIETQTEEIEAMKKTLIQLEEEVKKVEHVEEIVQVKNEPIEIED